MVHIFINQFLIACYNELLLKLQELLTFSVTDTGKLIKMLLSENQ